MLNESFWNPRYVRLHCYTLVKVPDLYSVKTYACGHPFKCFMGFALWIATNLYWRRRLFRNKRLPIFEYLDVEIIF